MKQTQSTVHPWRAREEGKKDSMEHYFWFDLSKFVIDDRLNRINTEVLFSVISDIKISAQNKIMKHLLLSFFVKPQIKAFQLNISVNMFV